MRWDRLTQKVQETIQGATDLADKRGHQAIEPEHIISTLLAEPGVATEILTKAGAVVPKIQDELEGLLKKFPRVEGVPGHTLSPRLNISRAARSV